MTHYDLFNGDADGICALTQYRLAFPAESVLVTGVKRDINLLKREILNPEMLEGFRAFLEKRKPNWPR